MGGPEDKVRTDRAVRLLDALTDYFRLRPTLILALIHDIANDLVDTIKEGGPQKGAGVLRRPI